MTVFNPIWRVTIDGVQYQSAVLANLTITSGRTNIYEQAQAGYINIELINLDQLNVPISINDSLTVELQNSAAAYVPICRHGRFRLRGHQRFWYFGGGVHVADQALA